MAKIGLKYPVAAVIKTEPTSGFPTYDTGFIVGKAISCEKNLESNNNPLYADDAVVENDTSFANGTLTLGVDDFGNTTEEGMEIQAKLLGHEIVTDGTTKVLRRKAGDNASNVGFGFYKTKIIRNVKMYEATLLYKVKFQLPSESANTKGESIEWQTPSIEGRIMAIDAGGTYEDTAIFETESEARDWLNTKLNVPTKQVGDT